PIILAFALIFEATRQRSVPTPPSEAMPKVEPITSFGNVIESAISPDGKYIAYVTADAGLQSLWLKQIATGSTLQLRPPERVGYWGHVFHPDGNSIYYSLRTLDDPRASL